MATEKLERNIEIIKMFCHGYGASKIAEKFDIPPPRVRTIMISFARRYLPAEIRRFYKLKREGKIK